jgi:hypothetical protein
MKVEFLKWGNSLALRVPKAFAQEMGPASSYSYRLRLVLPCACARLFTADWCAVTSVGFRLKSFWLSTY